MSDFGKKIRLKEKAEEDSYFARLDEQRIRALHEEQAIETRERNAKDTEDESTELSSGAAEDSHKSEWLDVMASRYRHLRARVLKSVFQAHTKLYEASDGRIGAWVGPPILGQPALLLSVTGRKSGLVRTTPLVYFEDGGNYILVGSDGAARRDPQWWKNLQENPKAEVRIGRNRFPVTASLATGAERDRLWQIGIRKNPMWARYQSRTRRTLPVVVLTPD